MARYIDAELLMQKLSRMIDYCQTDPKVSGLTALFQVGDAIMDCPTADVAPQAWNITENKPETWRALK